MRQLLSPIMFALIMFGCSPSLSSEYTLKLLNNHLHRTCQFFDSTRNFSIHEDTLVFRIGGRGTQTDWIPLKTTFISLDTIRYNKGQLWIFVKFSTFSPQFCCAVAGDNAVFRQSIPDVTLLFANVNDAQRTYILLSHLQYLVKSQKEPFDE